MAINFNFAKKFVAEEIIKQALNYLEKDPEKNFLKVLELADKVARTENHHQEIAAIKESYKTNPAIKQYIQRLSQVAPSYKNGMIMNFFVNAGLMGIHRQF
jgi:hypothetical protein